MNKAQEGSKGLRLVQSGSEGLTDGIEPIVETLYGHQTPRIHSRLREDLPSRGQEIIDFAASIGLDLLPWQAWLMTQATRVKEDGRYLHPLVFAMCARQNGKTTIMKARILAGLFLFDEKLQIGTAHRLTTSLETFRDLVNIIESNESLSSQVKKIRWAHGSEEIELKNGNRYMIKAGASAARGIAAPAVVHIDETRELKDESTWASLRYTMMASQNPQLWTYSNQGDQHSVILNQLRERGLAAAAGANDDIGYFEWSSGYEFIDDSEAFWNGIAQANPSLGHTIHKDNIRAILNDPVDVVKTEVMCVQVATISAAIPAYEWGECLDESLELDFEKTVFLGLDCSPDRRHAALVAGQRLDDENFMIKLLHTWDNAVSLDDKSIANEIADYCQQMPVEAIAYSKRTSSAIAARLVPAGLPIVDIDGGEYGQACDELLGAITSKRLKHKGQPELTKQILSAAKLPFGDGGWTIGRKASGTVVCATVASALATHFATRQETDIDILIG